MSYELNEEFFNALADIIRFSRSVDNYYATRGIEKNIDILNDILEIDLEDLAKKRVAAEIDLKDRMEVAAREVERILLATRHIGIVRVKTDIDETGIFIEIVSPAIIDNYNSIVSQQYFKFIEVKDQMTLNDLSDFRNSFSGKSLKLLEEIRAAIIEESKVICIEPTFYDLKYYITIKKGN